MKAELEQIRKRNERVEADKAWETSWTRRLIIALGTYFVIACFLAFINAPNPYFNALVPALGYLFSTLTMPFLKKYWLQNFYKK